MQKQLFARLRIMMWRSYLSVTAQGQAACAAQAQRVPALGATGGITLPDGILFARSCLCMLGPTARAEQHG